MRFRTALLVMIAAALAFTAAAFAEHGPGKPERNRPERSACRHHGHVLLKGTLVELGTDSFKMDVLKANRHGRKLKGEQTLQVDDKTRFKRKGKEGKAALADLVLNDRLLVLARCKPGETADSFQLVARFVFARPPKSEATPHPDHA